MAKTAVKKRNRFVRSIPFYIMALPGIIYLIVNNFMPLYGMLLAFKKLDVTKGIFGSPWVGFENFKFLFSTDTAFIIIRNTICYNLVFIIVGTVIAVALAVLLNEIRCRGFSKFYQSMLLIPYLISWVLASYLAYAFLAQDVGLINSVLAFFGKENIAWYSTQDYWPFILFFVYIWKNIGYMLIIYYSSIVSISADYFEAATIDGATKWQQIQKITLPLIKSTVVTMTILNLGRIANSDFGLFYQIPRNSGALYNVTQTIDVYVYNALMNNYDFSMSAAAAVFQSVVGFVFILAANAVVRKFSRKDALF